MKFSIWREADGEESAKVREAASVTQVAYDFAVASWDSEDADTLCIVVRDPAGAVHDIEIDVGWEPTFSVSKVETRDLDDDAPTGETVVLDEATLDAAVEQARAVVAARTGGAV